MMTLEEQKLAVCEKLSELVVFRVGSKMSRPYHREGFFWSCRYGQDNLLVAINWPTEGLQVCHEWIAVQPSTVREEIQSRAANNRWNKLIVELDFENWIEIITCYLNESGGE